MTVMVHKSGDVQKEKYVYYRCTGNRGKCDLPRFREEVLSDRLKEPLKDLQVPPGVVTQIVDAIRKDQEQSETRLCAERTRSESRLTGIRNRIDAAYIDKLDGKISEEFWRRKTDEWTLEEQQLKVSIDGLAKAAESDRPLDAERVFELANKAYSLCV